MVRKSKDLFVLLAERQQRSKSKSSGTAASGGGTGSRSTASRGTASSGTASGDVTSAAREMGSTLGRWVQGAVRTMRGDEEQKGSAKTKTKAKTRPGAKAVPGRGSNSGAKAGGGRRPIREVPKGLLIPGWLLAGMIVVGIGSGFVVGRVTSGLTADLGLDGRVGARKPAEFTPENGSALSAVEEERVLHNYFFVCRVVGPNGRDEAAALALAMREEGIAKARIRAISVNGSISNWVTVCYVASNPAPPGIHEALKRLAKPLGLDLESYPGLQEPKDG